MFTSRASRLALLCVALISHGADGGARAQSQASAPAGLVVHAWGTFTSVAGRDGGALMWRPLSFESHLPSFVHSIDEGATWEGGLRYQSKSRRPVTVRMETSLLYFYAGAETGVSVKVGFPAGRSRSGIRRPARAEGESTGGGFRCYPARASVRRASGAIIITTPPATDGLTRSSAQRLAREMSERRRQRIE
jgi:hypothetical protein